MIPADIVPMDIAKTANTLGRKYDLDYHPRMVIARAILAERQRCADVATKEGNGYRDNNLPLCAMGAYQVSKAILSGVA